MIFPKCIFHRFAASIALVQTIIYGSIHTLWFIRDTFIRDIYKFPKKIRDIPYACQKNVML